jgi:hypothetical protein
MKFKIFFCQFPNPWALRVSGMGGYTSKCEKSQNHCTLLSNQSDLPAFFSPRQVNLKISHSILPNPTIPEDDLPRMVKFRKMTWPRLAKIPAYDKPDSQKRI